MRFGKRPKARAGAQWEVGRRPPKRPYALQATGREKIELYVNIKAARALGVSVPLSLLERVDGGDRVNGAMSAYGT